MEDNKIQEIYVLKDGQALLLMSKSDFNDDTNTLRKAGTKWLINGPRDYVPPVQVEVLENRVSIPLDQNEGIYIRDSNTGEVRSIIGQTYLLKSHETLFEKELPIEVENLLNQKIKRDKTRVVRFNVPHNNAA